MSERTGWFADVYNECASDPTPPELVGKWQPVLQIGGACLPLDVWFDSAEACEDFIATEVIGQGMLP
jgi:hypothetical protein